MRSKIQKNMAGPLVSPTSSRRKNIGLVDRYSETFFRIPVPVIFHSIAPRREKQTSASSAIITLSHPNHGKRVLLYIDEAPTNNCFLLSGAFQMFAKIVATRISNFERRLLSQD